MNLFGGYETAKELDTYEADPMIDFFEFYIPKTNPLLPRFSPGGDTEDTELVVDWKVSVWNYDQETGKGSFQADQVLVSDLDADGSIDLFKGSRVVALQFYAPGWNSPKKLPFKITDLIATDGDEFYVFKPEQYTGYRLDVVQ